MAEAASLMPSGQERYPAYFLASLAVGALLGLLWDLLVLLRIEPISERGRGGIPWMLQLAAGDLTLSLAAAVSVSLLAYAMNYGRIRAFSLLALLGGGMLWRSTLSRLLRRLLFPIKRGILSLLRRMHRAIAGRIAARIGSAAARAYTRRQCRRLCRTVQAMPKTPSHPPSPRASPAERPSRSSKGKEDIP